MSNCVRYSLTYCFAADTLSFLLLIFFDSIGCDWDKTVCIIISSLITPKNNNKNINLIPEVYQNTYNQISALDLLDPYIHIYKRKQFQFFFHCTL